GRCEKVRIGWDAAMHTRRNALRRSNIFRARTLKYSGARPEKAAVLLRKAKLMQQILGGPMPSKCHPDVRRDDNRMELEWLYALAGCFRVKAWPFIKAARASSYSRTSWST